MYEVDLVKYEVPPYGHFLCNAGIAVYILRLVSRCSSLITFTSQPLYFRAKSLGLKK
jgi:hypothetical protein